MVTFSNCLSLSQSSYSILKNQQRAKLLLLSQLMAKLLMALIYSTAMITTSNASSTTAKNMMLNPLLRFTTSLTPTQSPSTRKCSWTSGASSGCARETRPRCVREYWRRSSSLLLRALFFSSFLPSSLDFRLVRPYYSFRFFFFHSAMLVPLFRFIESELCSIGNEKQSTMHQARICI